MECPVCYEVYQTPLLLPGCGHTVCKSCATMLLKEPSLLLRCPECRLIYHLKQGIKSLPKNVALERTIQEQNSGASRITFMCDEHPEDNVALYCKTCEKSICLKCFFASNTLRKGQSAHAGHDVDTSEDAFTKEKRILEERKKACINMRCNERQYVQDLEKTQTELEDVLTAKVASVEQHRDALIQNVRKTSSKLLFTLKGSAARDRDNLEHTLASAKERLKELDGAVERADQTLIEVVRDSITVNGLKDMNKKLEKVTERNKIDSPSCETFLRVMNFDTDVELCLREPDKALAYQTDVPLEPVIEAEQCVISNTSVLITVTVNPKIRIKQILLFYKEGRYKGLSEKEYTSVACQHVAGSKATHLLQQLKPGSLYRLYAVANNDFGKSAPSKELWFRTLTGDLEVHVT